MVENRDMQSEPCFTESFKNMELGTSTEVYRLPAPMEARHVTNPVIVYERSVSEGDPYVFLKECRDRRRQMPQAESICISVNPLIEGKPSADVLYCSLMLVLGNPFLYTPM